MVAYSVQCLTCSNYTLSNTCLAYPEGIPIEIMTGEVDHKQPYAGDNGIRWENARGKDGKIEFNPIPETEV